MQHRTMKRSLMLCFALLLLIGSAFAQSHYLFHNGESNYRIILSSEASASENTAANDLQYYLWEISGAWLPIINDLEATGPKIFVGYNDKVAQLTGASCPAETDEAYTYQSVGSDIIIYGGSVRGTFYGVCSFLENELGMRWHTWDYTKIPRIESWQFDNLYHSEQPTIAYRYSNYWRVNFSFEWSARNKENMKWVGVEHEFGNHDAYWGCHTMGLLVPADEFFATHPEYFALHDGERIPDGQLCLSNPDVLQICTERLRQVMQEEPLYRFYDLSQNDNWGYCECAACNAIENAYGGHSGLIVWFVNQAAETLEAEFPDKYVGTFAYMYSRQPPVGIVPRENVVIRLCDIECCFAHPLSSNCCPENQSFMEDLQAWSEIAPHLFIWDYVVNYSQFIAPFPNFQVLGPNIRTYANHQAIGVLEEAQYLSEGAEFEEMKAWVITKLLWNPDQDVNELCEDFIFGYYGQGAQYIWDYYLLCQSLVTPDLHFGIYIGEWHPLFNDDFIAEGFELLNAAREQAENEEIADRIDRVRLQLLYLQSVRYPEESVCDGTWDEFVLLARRFGARPHEWITLEEFIEWFESEYDCETGIVELENDIPSAYPNPAKSNIMLPYVLEDGETATMSIYDLNSRLIERFEIDSHSNQIQVNVSEYSPGMYLYEYKGKGGKFIVR